MQINIENYEYADCIDEAALIDLTRQLAALAQEQARTQIPWQELTIHLLSDRTIAPVHQAVNGVAGSTDVITQRYDPFPGEPEGLIGEIFVNLQCAGREADKIRSQESGVSDQFSVISGQLSVVSDQLSVVSGQLTESRGEGEKSRADSARLSVIDNPESSADWSVDQELALYIAHGCDHLNDNNDLSEKGYLSMRARELSWIAQLRLTPVVIKPIL